MRCQSQMLITVTLLLLIVTQTRPHVHARVTPSITLTARNLNPVNARETLESCDWSHIEHNLEDTDDNLSLCEKAFRIGTHLTCMMNQPGGFDSVYTTTAQLSEWGWKSGSSMGVNHSFLSLKPVLNTLGHGTVADRARWGSISQTHGKSVERDGGSFPATGGQYNNYVNLQDGIIIAYRNDGPVYVNDERPRGKRIAPDQITKLRNFSDLFFLGLQDLARRQSLDMRKVQHVIRYQVTNAKTIRVLQAVIGKEDPEDHRTWPNPYSYGIDTPQAKAVIGTPNGRGVAWLLGQHKSTLGAKIIDQVKIWNCAVDPDDDEAEWCIYFHIVPAPLSHGQLR